MLLIDYKKVYDGADKEELFALLEAINVEKCIMNTLKCPL
jgi:hypothetical protein